MALLTPEEVQTQVQAVRSLRDAELSPWVLPGATLSGADAGG